jgi:hypothetical protein
VVVLGRLDDGDRTGLSIKHCSLRARPKRPLPLVVRHEADAVGPLAVIEAGYADVAAVLREDGVEGHVEERIAL